MKRKPSQEMLSSDLTTKPTIKRLKSPNTKKLIPKKQDEPTPLIVTRHRINRSREQVKADSNNTTVSAKPKSHKSIKLVKHKAQKLAEYEIMNIINLFASKIQRQWRVYMFRKRINAFISQNRAAKAMKEKSSKQRKLQIDQNKIKQMAKFQEDFNQSEENHYDRLKYKEPSPQKLKKKVTKQQPNPPSSNSSKEWSKVSGTSKSCSITPRCRIQDQKAPTKTPREVPKSVNGVSKSLQRPHSSQNLLEFNKQKEQRRASFNSLQPQKLSQNRRHSTGDLQVPLITRTQLKIGKAFELYIQQQRQTPKLSENSLQQCRKMQKIDNEGAIAFGKVPYLEEMKGHFRKELQMTKFKQLISAENRYKKNEVTYRSYLQIVGKIKKEHSSKLQEIKQKEGELKSTWNQLLALYKNNNEVRFTQDQNNNHSHLDVSVSFQRWDFNSSAKKSIDCFDFPDNNCSKILSIQSVLKELEEEQSSEGLTKHFEQDKPFKKNKSLKAIEPIDERSKEISEKDADMLQETPEKKQIDKKQILKRLIAVEDISQKVKTELEENVEQQQNVEGQHVQFYCEEQSLSNKELATNQAQNQNLGQARREIYAQFITEQTQKQVEESSKKNEVSLQIEPIKLQRIQLSENNDQITPSNKRVEEVSPSQSLLITPASPASHHLIILSEENLQPEKEKSLPQSQKDQLPQHMNEVQKSEPKEPIIREVVSPSESLEKTHPMVSRFRELVIEKMVMTNIKLINSIKFVCARAGQQRKRIKIAKSMPHPIDTGINAVNTWLLQISHFVLDNYQQMVRDNLVQVRQPPANELLSMARKGQDIIPIYQTIQEYGFKDFQFYYIKTLARNVGIPPQAYDKFSSLTYTFHRVLVDSLNTALMEELSTGKIWIKTPWHVPRKYKANRICLQQAKLSLQRSINVVSNWGEYNLGRLTRQEEVSEAQHKQYEQQKINLVCRQEVLDMNFCFIFSLGHVLLEVAERVVEEEWLLAAKQILAIAL